MKLETVQLVDVFPNPKNPRKDFSGIDELAATFENGVPWQPIQVIKQGGIYTIVDGERRYRAMKKLGTKSCMALVAENQEDADALVAMVATNNKKQLTEIELSQGIQQAIVFADIERVEKATGRTNLKRAKRAMEKVDDYAEDMSIDRLIAIDEFADDPKSAELLTKCKESEWRKIYAQIKQAKKEAETKEKLIRVVKEAGIEPVSEYPHQARMVRVTNNPDELAELIKTYEASEIAVRISDYGVTLYRFDKDANAEREKIAEEAARLKNIITDSESRQLLFVFENASNLGTNTLKLIFEAFGERRLPILNEYYRTAGIESEPEYSIDDFSVVDILLGFWDAFKPCNCRTYDLATGKSSKYNKDFWVSCLNRWNALQADGYEFSAEEREVIEKIGGLSYE